jgi:sulfoxide reductase heme-binding subunit YedZ
MLKSIIHISALLPVIYLYSLAFSDQLGADPVEELIHFTGIGALNLLLITLCISPLAKRIKKSRLIKTRRLLGLYAFLYALLHIINFFVFEIQFDGKLFINEVIERPYITLGMLAFLLLSVLAVTSIDSIKRKMGKNWQSLHNTIYLLIILVAIHFYWSVKSVLILPVIYCLLCVILLTFRYLKLKRFILSLLA